MLWVAIILLALVAPLLWALLAPLRMFCDTDRAEAGAELYGLGRVGLDWRAQPPVLRWRVLFYEKAVPLSPERAMQKRKKRAKPEEEEDKKKRSARKERAFPIRPALMVNYGKKLARTFCVRRFHLSLDTGDPITNAYLIPVLAMLPRNERIRTGVNWEERLYLAFVVENRLAKVAWVGMRFYIALKFSKRKP